MYSRWRTSHYFKWKHFTNYAPKPFISYFSGKIKQIACSWFSQTSFSRRARVKFVVFLTDFTSPGPLIPGVLCQCPQSQLVLSAVHDDNIECFLNWIPMFERKHFKLSQINDLMLLVSLFDLRHFLFFVILVCKFRDHIKSIVVRYNVKTVGSHF
jgi:hypothetical protein